MVAIGFTNLVFFSYALYLAIERKQHVVKSRTFWWCVLGLCVSLFVAWVYMAEGPQP